jgi:integrase
MATISKRGQRWRVQVFRRGIRVAQSFRLKGDALAWARETEAAIEECRYGMPSCATLRDVLDRYAEDVSPSKRGSKAELVRLRNLALDPIAENGLSAVTTEALSQWRDRRLEQVSTGTVLREITLLSAVFEHARKEWKLMEVNPIRDMRKPKTPRHRERLPTDDEIDRLTLALGYDGRGPFETPAQQTAIAFLLAIETAMRSGELLGLRWSDVDLVRRVATLTVTKNGDKREVPLSTRAIELFENLRGNNQEKCFSINGESRDSAFRHARGKAGIVGITFHDSRALALTRLSKKLDVLQLARVVGHRDPRSLMIYYRESAADMAKLLE